MRTSKARQCKSFMTGVRWSDLLIPGNQACGTDLNSSLQIIYFFIMLQYIKKTLTIILARHEESRVIDHRLQVILAKIFNLPISQLG